MTMATAKKNVYFDIILLHIQCLRNTIQLDWKETLGNKYRELKIAKAQMW